MMMNLLEALQATSWRRLKIIGRQRGLRFSSNISKAALISDLQEQLADPANLAQTLDNLPAAAREMLADILTAGGRLPRHHLLSETAGEAALQRLLNRGLIFEIGNEGVLFFPADLLALLPPPDLSPPEPLEALPDGEIEPADLLCHDLAVFLALLRRSDITPLHQRWLPPRFLAEWGQACRVSPCRREAGSELQTGRRRFLHYLAENSGLVPALIANHAAPGVDYAPTAPVAYLKPGPAAWLWLAADRQERLQRLWEAWLRPEPDRWRKFQLPGAEWLTDPAALIGPLLPGLLEIDPADPKAFARTFLKRYPQHRDLIPANRLRPLSLLVGTIVELLTGPLCWLGVLQKKEGESGEYVLTGQGRTWLTAQSLPPSQVPQPARFSLSADIRPNLFDSRLTLSVRQGLPDPADVAVVIELAVSADESEGVTVESSGDREPAAGADQLDRSFYYHVTAASLVQAIHHGWRPPALLAALDQLVDRPLTAGETALLQSWAAAADKMKVHLACLLETGEPGVIRRLAATHRGRTFIQQTLSPGTVKVDPARVPALVQRLTRQEGVPPLVIGRARFEARPATQTVISVSDAAHLWLALHVYQALSQHIKLPAHTSQSLWDYLAALAGPAQLSAAEIAAEQTLSALKRLIDGLVAFSTWTAPALPVEDTVSLLEEAVASGSLLQMSYYTAGRDELTHRQVEPYRLEWRGETPYLVGFCYRAWQERIFRVDRIQAVTLVQKVKPDSDVAT